MHGYVAIIIIFSYIASHSYFTIHPMHSCIRTLIINFFWLLAQVTSRPSVKTHLYIIALIRCTNSVIQFVEPAVKQFIIYYY